MKNLTTKQLGDAGEFLVAAELSFHGIPTLVVPDNWPAYDLVAHCPIRGLQRISVKTRAFGAGNFVAFKADKSFDWLSIVVLPRGTCQDRRIFIVPYAIAVRRSHYAAHRKGRGFMVGQKRLFDRLQDYENNFSLEA
jgi:hypothetical protein